MKIFFKMFVMKSNFEFFDLILFCIWRDKQNFFDSIVLRSISEKYMVKFYATKDAIQFYVSSVLLAVSYTHLTLPTNREV